MGICQSRLLIRPALHVAPNMNPYIELAPPAWRTEYATTTQYPKPTHGQIFEFAYQVHPLRDARLEKPTIVLLTIQALAPIGSFPTTAIDDVVPYGFGARSPTDGLYAHTFLATAAALAPQFATAIKRLNAAGFVPILLRDVD